MILTKFQLDLRHPSVRQALMSCQDMHRNVQKLFAGPRAEEQVLYRVYLNRVGGALYVWSKTAPAGTDAYSGLKQILQQDKSDWLDSLTEGQKFRFDLVASPTKKVKVEGVKNSRRRTLRTPEEQAQWLVRKGEQFGFSLLQLDVGDKQTLSGGRAKGGLVMDTVHFMGVLRIEDKAKFLSALTDGIGSGKAYGAGLLLLS